MTQRNVVLWVNTCLTYLRTGLLKVPPDVAYPVFVAKVPEGKGFVDSAIGGTIVLRFDDIFAMFNLYPLHYTFVRLFSLSMEMRIIRDKTPDIVIVDPFYMCAKHLRSAGDRQVARSHLEGVILANPNKDNVTTGFPIKIFIDKPVF